MISSRVKHYNYLYQLRIDDADGFGEKEAAKLSCFKKWNRVLDESNNLFTNVSQAGRS